MEKGSRNKIIIIIIVIIIVVVVIVVISNIIGVVDVVIIIVFVIIIIIIIIIIVLIVFLFFLILQKELCGADLVVFGTVYPLLQEKGFQGNFAVFSWKEIVIWKYLFTLLCWGNNN